MQGGGAAVGEIRGVAVATDVGEGMFVREGGHCDVCVGAEEVFVEVEEVGEAAAGFGGGVGEGFEIGLLGCY